MFLPRRTARHVSSSSSWFSSSVLYCKSFPIFNSLPFSCVPLPFPGRQVVPPLFLNAPKCWSIFLSCDCFGDVFLSQFSSSKRFFCLVIPPHLRGLLYHYRVFSPLIVFTDPAPLFEKSPNQASFGSLDSIGPPSLQHLSPPMLPPFASPLHCL